jgi:hypothetical protein
MLWDNGLSHNLTQKESNLDFSGGRGVYGDLPGHDPLGDEPEG